MALRQLLNRSCNSPDAVFRTIRDFLVAQNGIDDFRPGGSNPGPGYEIVDASYASGDPTNTTSGDWCVMRSHGEANSYPVYMKLDFGATMHSLNPYLAWDSAGHSGNMGLARSNVYHNGAGDVTLYIYADLDEIHIVIKPQSIANWYWSVCGRLKPGMTVYDGAALQVSSAIPAGANTTISMPSWPGWAEVGKKLYSWDASGLGEVEISDADVANLTVTLASSAARTAGSWLVEDAFVFASAGGTSGTAQAGGNNSLYGLPNRDGVTTATAYTPILPAISGNDGKYGDRFTADIWIQRDGEVRGRFALARVSRFAPSAQGEAWTDEAGNNWRLHTVFNNTGMAFREAD